MYQKFVVFFFLILVYVSCNNSSFLEFRLLCYNLDKPTRNSHHFRLCQLVVIFWVFQMSLLLERNMCLSTTFGDSVPISFITGGKRDVRLCLWLENNYWKMFDKPNEFRHSIGLQAFFVPTFKDFIFCLFNKIMSSPKTFFAFEQII